MSEFNSYNWLEALISVFERATRDPDYRSLCVSDPAAAVKEVSDIELPPDFRVAFIDSREQYFYSYLLPPPGLTGTTRDDEIKQLLRWSVLCTVDPTTHG